jgi:peptidoglycan/LPS O-acetylase OafA/YrhL
MTVRSDSLPMQDVAPVAPTRHLRYIDGMRGASASYVVLFHMWQFASSRFTGAPPRWWRLFDVLQYGDCGVAVFIVVSGYCLMLPVAASDGLQLRGGRLRFAERRIRRLGPGYIAALVGTLALVMLVPSMHHHSGSSWDVSLPLSFGTIASHLLLIDNWRLGWRYAIDTPMWTVALEVQIYVVFVLVLLPLWRRAVRHRPSVVVVAACAVVTVVLMLTGLAWVQPWMLLLFALGMCAAEASQRRAGLLSRRIDLVVVPLVVLVPIVLELDRSHFWDFNGVLFVREVFVGLVFAVLLLALTRATPEDGRITAWIGRVFSVRPLTWLGEISYSLYLVHFPIVGAIALTLVYGRGLDEPANFALIVVAGGAASLLVAVGFHRLFERGYLVRRNVITTVTTA